jgi:hypothetical protein
MNKLIAAVALATVVASPAFAQSYDPSVGSGNLNSAPFNSGQSFQWGTPYNARAQAPQLGKGTGMRAQTPRVGKGHRSPYAQYDINGNLIDENMPGRW